MRLATKLSLAAFLLLLAILFVHSLLTVRRQRELFHREIASEGLSLGRALATALHSIQEQLGDQEALEILERINQERRGLQIRWLPLDGDGPPSSQRPSWPLSSQERSRLLRGEALTRVNSTTSKGAEIDTYVPLPTPGPERQPSVLEIRTSLADRDAYVQKTLRWILSALLLFSLLGGALSHWLGRRLVGQPVEKLIQLARRVGGGDFLQSVAVHRNDELTELAIALNEMCEELEKARVELEAQTQARARVEAQLRHADRLKTVGTLATGLAHEIGTPLNVVIGRAKLLRKATDLERARRHGESIEGEARRIHTIVQRLLGFARRQPVTFRRVDLGEVAEEAVGLLRDLPLARGRSLEFERSRAPTTGDSTQLQQVLANLLTNALQAGEPGTRVVVRTGVEEATPPPNLGLGEGRYSFLQVEDNGPGMAPETRERIFEPFFTTKDVGEGTGLGLSVSYGIVREHGGWIEVESQPGSGACFTVRLPLGEEA